MDYKHGDIVNGHMYDSASNSWVPVPAGTPLPAPDAATAAPLAPPPGPEKKGLGKGAKIGIAAGALVLVFIVIGAMASSGSQTNNASTPSPTPTSSASTPEASTPSDNPTSESPAPEATSDTPTPEASTPAAPEGTVSQMQALGAARDYLNTAPFSQAALIAQLSSSYGSGFSKADAVWAVKQLTDVNWNYQAYLAGKSYLEMTHFSRNGLIQQLTSKYGSQFTKAQALYAVKKLGL